MNLREIVAQLVAEQLPVSTVPGKVLRVDKAAATCDVQPVEADTPEMFDVRLRAVDDGSATGFIAWPLEGSLVLVSIIDNDVNTAFVSATSQVESFTLSAGSETLATVMQDLVKEIQAMIFTTNQGPTIKLLNSPKFDLLANRLTSLLTP